jgi:hypothetical protein
MPAPRRPLRDPEALRRFVPATPQAEGEAEPRGHRDGADAGEEAATPVQVGFPDGATDRAKVERDHPRAVDPNVVPVEPDEVKIHARSHVRRERVLAPTAR